ncbi:EpsG family protein [Bacteroides xylanisolvens]|uniref:EpsG family protein n=1 Tax=Bacteroides xylanisolvens TaxID=371601 RepID=UPI00125FD1CE|nr:EpsG family protein [Bacteroides xylanisolvens]KAB6402232.1 hypothetical protein GAZ19_20920 [Bacteroides xylanisolvens]KAB6413940.1 hypothetical protein GAZ18_17585 [Bacteroides xylanisolvens]KAB6420861.1 hypothetical protein GAZ14_21145 [Bacteroides xylanisolvens]KAB6434235.1 hypothetical protein GAZ16_16355 [Bacteroides xylanisolvens]
MKYHYEAVPVLFNILLFFLMLYPFPNVYRYGCEFRKRYTDILDYAVYGVLLILFCTFGYADNDFYHYEGLFKRICSTGLNVHLEPVYYWLIRNVTSNYLVWRFIVWSGTVILSLWTIKRLKLDVRIGLLIFVLFYINIISVMRGNLGIAILFFGFSFIIRPSHNRLLSFLFGCLLIFCSFFFHKSMLFSIAALSVTPFYLNRKTVKISLVIFPFLTVVTTLLLDYIIMNGLIGFDIADMNIGSSMTGYASGTMRQSNIFGKLNQMITYMPVYASLALMTKKIVFEEIDVPRYIKALFIYWYVITYIASLFFFQETSVWLFIRFIMMSYFPLCIVVGYYYSNFKMTREKRILMLLAILPICYKLFYAFYKRLVWEGYVFF